MLPLIVSIKELQKVVDLFF